MYKISGKTKCCCGGHMLRPIQNAFVRQSISADVFIHFEYQQKVLLPSAERLRVNFSEDQSGAAAVCGSREIRRRSFRRIGKLDDLTGPVGPRFAMTHAPACST